MNLETGRICLKIAGREAGKYCVVVEPAGEGFVLVTGPKTVTRVKRRKCNVLHLEPTEHALKLTSTDDSAVENAWKASGYVEKLGISIPTRRKEKKGEK